MPGIPVDRRCAPAVPRRARLDGGGGGAPGMLGSNRVCICCWPPKCGTGRQPGKGLARNRLPPPRRPRVLFCSAHNQRVHLAARRRSAPEANCLHHAWLLHHSCGAASYSVALRGPGQTPRRHLANSLKCFGTPGRIDVLRHSTPDVHIPPNAKVPEETPPLCSLHGLHDGLESVGLRPCLLRILRVKLPPLKEGGVFGVARVKLLLVTLVRLDVPSVYHHAVAINSFELVRIRAPAVMAMHSNDCQRF